MSVSMPKETAVEQPPRGPVIEDAEAAAGFLVFMERIQEPVLDAVDGDGTVLRPREL